jgi:hypothetical protein
MNYVMDSLVKIISMRRSKMETELLEKLENISETLTQLRGHL